MVGDSASIVPSHNRRRALDRFHIVLIYALGF